MDLSWLVTSWTGPLRVVGVGVLAYIALIVLLRGSGKRTLTKMNAFDLVVTVALGSTLATILLSTDVSLVEGVTALALLIALQYVITWLSIRSNRIAHLVKAEPSLLLYDGKFLSDALRRERVTEAEVRAAIREHGSASLEEVQAVVLETDGSFSVIDRGDRSEHSALANVARDKGTNRPRG
jgi:uncharacterized membrane protein YcaP (DUF421 family)